MTVSFPHDQRIIITLTNTEVLSAFGSYERLYTLNKQTKYAVNALLREVINSHKIFDKTDKILAKIKLKKPDGCEITLFCENNEYILYFTNGEELSKAISSSPLTELKINKSSLYKLDSEYYLFIESERPFFFFKEFFNRAENNKIIAEYIKEYSKPLIKNNAIEIYSKIIKDF